MKRQEIKQIYKRTKIKVEKNDTVTEIILYIQKKIKLFYWLAVKKENILTLKFVLYWCMDSCVRWSISFRILLMTIKESNKQLKNVYFYERQF